MATRRPIKWDYTLNGFKEWSDSEIGALKYNLAVAFGNYLNGGGIGAVGGVSTGTGKADIFNPAGGSTTDTRRNAASNSNTAGGGTGTDYPGYPSTTTSTISSSRWQQNLDAVGMPSAATITDQSFLYYKGSGYQFQYINTETDFLDTIVNDAISIMRTGHEVGTYRVGTNRGSMSDRRQESSSTSQNYSNPNYFSHRTPSGGASNITNYYFKLI